MARFQKSSNSSGQRRQHVGKRELDGRDLLFCCLAQSTSSHLSSFCSASASLKDDRTVIGADIKRLWRDGSNLRQRIRRLGLVAKTGRKSRQEAARPTSKGSPEIRSDSTSTPFVAGGAPSLILNSGTNGAQGRNRTIL